MIRGAVTADRDALIPVRVVGPGGSVTVTAVVDTGFTDDLTLPAALVASLGLTWLLDEEATLGDGSVVPFAVHYAEVEWHGGLREVMVQASDVDPLVGMGLLADSTLFIACQPGGAVEITPAPPPPAPAP